jgi:hypothetical protein
MLADAQGEHTRKALALLVILVAAVALCPFSAHPQNTGKHLSKQDIIDLLTGDVTSERVAEIAKEKGISFDMTAATEKGIRAAGGSDDLISVLRGLAPPAPVPPSRPPRTSPAAGPPPVLVIQSNPGGGRVYVDDEPVGSTTREGSLKLARFSPGSHQVRISLSGYRDYEKSVTLTAGQTTIVAVTLQPTAARPAANPPQLSPAVETPAVSPGEAGTLGAEVMTQQPAGARGVVVSGAKPGSPAERAGIKAYDTILAVGGRPVRTPQELNSAVSSHRAGEVVAVTWYDGATNLTRQVRFAAALAGAETEVAAPPNSPQSLKTPQTGFVSFPVAHDHGSGGRDYCTGVMSIGNGMIYYKSTNGRHVFEIPLNSVTEARRNALYLSGRGAFHLRLAKGTSYVFVALNQYGEFQPPGPILNAIRQASGKLR